MDSQAVPITGLKEDDEAIVQSVSGGEALAARLAGMGLVPGTRVRVLRNRAGAVILLASDTRVALGRGEASRILVIPTETVEETGSLLVALAGQPNVGKSTVFNILTGLSQHVGNWPGKTVEKKEGVHVAKDMQIRIVDLPGTYSLTAFSEEERAARDFIINERPDVIVVIVNAAALERSLYLLSEILLLDVPTVLGVNMVDVAESQGIRVDIGSLEKSLGLPVVPLVATKNKGIRELVDLVVATTKSGFDYQPRQPDVSADHRAIFLSLLDLVRDHIPPLYTGHWVVVKLMEGDPEVTAMMESLLPGSLWKEVQKLLGKHEDALRAVVGGRYDWIEKATRASVSRFRRGQVLITDRIDHVLTRPLLGIPLLLGILAIVFALTYAVGFPLQQALEGLMSAAAGVADRALSGAPSLVRGLIVNGIIGGAGSVLTFLPILLIFFACLTFLEDVGYMARAAFVMDRFMHVVGLHGKSFLPLCVGFGCNVPSVMGSRIVESRKARLLTVFLAPFIPCTGRLGVLTFITAAVFGRNGSVVMWILLALNILVLGVSGVAISRFLMKGEEMPFIMELPLYHRPDFRTIAMIVWVRIVAFVRKAGTVILLAAVAVWLLSNLPEGNIETSILGRIGRFLEPVGRPMGLRWQEMVALVSSVVAKENSIATLSVLFGVGREGLVQVLPRFMAPASAFAFLVSLMLFVPCAATVAVMKQEMGSWKWFLASFCFMLLISFFGGVAAYNIASLFS